MANNIFTGNLNSPDSDAILFNCPKNVKWKIKEISKLSKGTKASQIKGMKQPSDLTDSVQLIPGKLITKLLITKLQTQVTELTDKKSKLSVQIDQKYQYSRGNCILKLGVEEKQNEENDTISINIIKEHLRLDNQPSNIDGTHCIGGKMNCVRKVEKYLLRLEGSIFEKKKQKKKVQRIKYISYRKFDFLKNHKIEGWEI